MAAQKTPIEFLPQEKWEQGTIGRILKWALTVGRFIVVFTELIVILAFLSRFKFDRDLTDLNEEIKQKKAIVTASAGFEKDFRFLQKQIETIEKLKNKQLAVDLILNEISSLVPIDITLSDFSVQKQTLTLTASALSEQGLATFLANLKNSKRFTNLVLSQLSTDTQTEVGIQFQLKSELASEPKNDF